jgi:putative DNA primase/helicase
MDGCPSRSGEACASTLGLENRSASILEGSRNDSLYRLARSLNAKGLSAPAIEAAVKAENAARCKPPLSDEEVDNIVENVLNQPNRADFGTAGTPLAATSQQAGRQTRPRIIVTNRQLRSKTGEALDALRRANCPPTVFRRIGTLTRVRRNEQSNPILEPLSEGALRGLLARTADWHRVTITGNLAAVSPPIDVVQDILALSEWPDIPPIRGIVEAPTFAPDGSLLTHAGYHPAAQLWFHCAPGLDAPVISSKPKESEIEAAREFLLYELLGEFPFEDEASRAHVLVATLLPFVREMVLGPTPLHLIDAPSPGTGKGLLADVINIPATGRSATIMSEGQNDEEWRKRITAILMGGPVFVLIDNLRQRLDSPALAAALTGGTWTDRILGRTAMATLPVRAVWVATGNNITLSNEMARRAVRIRLDAKVDKPWTRSGFNETALLVRSPHHGVSGGLAA